MRAYAHERARRSPELEVGRGPVHPWFSRTLLSVAVVLQNIIVTVYGTLFLTMPQNFV